MRTVLSLKDLIPWIVAWMKPRFRMSSRYWACRLRPRMMPRAASWRPPCVGLASRTAAREASQPDASSVLWTSVLSMEQVQIAEATAARVSTTLWPPPWVAAQLSKAAMSASTPPLCRTVRQSSSFTAKLLRKRQTATTRDGRLTHLFSTSTSTVMLPPCCRERLWRVRFAMSARVVIASSRTTGLFWCFESKSTMTGMEPSRVRIVSELSTTLSRARPSRQHLIIAASPEWRLSRAVSEDSRPFWIAMFSFAASCIRNRDSSWIMSLRHCVVGKSSCARSHEHITETSRCSVAGSRVSTLAEPSTSANRPHRVLPSMSLAFSVCVSSRTDSSALTESDIPASSAGSRLRVGSESPGHRALREGTSSQEA
mmetsp:Transcript_74616/g.218575  ORF Transcript_74616/g.218575 Transcript_74616/m.218575 type:complete len:370 (+) Transcript_74616:924-2033(+)